MVPCLHNGGAHMRLYLYHKKQYLKITFLFCNGIPMPRPSIPHSFADISDDYVPLPTFYDPHIFVRQWEVLLQNPKVTTADTINLLQVILVCGGEVTCAQLSADTSVPPITTMQKERISAGASNKNYTFLIALIMA